MYTTLRRQAELQRQQAEAAEKEEGAKRAMFIRMLERDRVSQGSKEEAVC